MKILTGTYKGQNSLGIYQFDLDSKTGKFKDKRLFLDAPDSKYLKVQDGLIYTIIKRNDRSGVAVFQDNQELIDELLFEDGSSCHIEVVDSFIYTTNYSEGTVTKINFTNNKLQFIDQICLKNQAGCHQIIPYKNLLLIPCLLLDRVFILNANLQIVKTIDFKEGTGPRHGVFKKDLSKLYLVSELNNQLFEFQVIDLDFKLTRLIELTKDDEKNEGAAAIRLFNDENKLLVSTRFSNQVHLIDLAKNQFKVTQIINLPGDHPRDILNVLDDKFLLVANRFTNEVLSYGIKNQKITDLIDKIEIHEAVALVTLEEK